VIRRLPLAVLAALAVLMVIRGGYYPPVGFEGEVYNATVYGDSLFAACGMSAERDWAVQGPDGRVYVVRPGEVAHINGRVRLAELYATRVDLGGAAASVPVYSLWPVQFYCDQRPSNYVIIDVYNSGYEITWGVRVEMDIGYPVCDSGSGMVDPACGQCRQYVTIQRAWYTLNVCTDPIYYRLGSINVYTPARVPETGLSGRGVRIYTAPGTTYLYCLEGGNCIVYDDEVLATYQGGYMEPLGDWGGINAHAAFEVKPGARIPVGFPPGVQLPAVEVEAITDGDGVGVWYIRDSMPDIITVGDVASRLNSWSNPYRTAYAVGRLYMCFNGTQGWPLVLIFRWELTRVIDEPWPGWPSGDYIRGDGQWRLLSQGQCVMLGVTGEKPVVGVRLTAQLFQMVSWAPMWRTWPSAASFIPSDYMIGPAVVGETRDGVVFLPPTYRYKAHGSVALREVVLGEAAVPQWLSDVAKPRCPRSSGGEWPGIPVSEGGQVAECYGRAVVGVVAQGHGYVEVEWP